MTRTRIQVPFAGWTLVGLLALSLTLNGCKNKKAASGPAAADLVVTIRSENIALATLTDLRSGPTISGSLEPEQQATIRAEVAGAVQQMTADIGQQVKRGQLLGRIEETAMRDAYLSAKSAVRTAEATLENARRNAERASRLAQAGALATRELENAQWTVTNAEGALADARARHAAAEEQLGHTTLRAPFDGVVSSRPADPGDVVQIGVPLITIVDPRDLRLEASVPAAQVGRLRVGMPVEFTVSGFSRRFTGRIQRINPVVDSATRQVRIYVSVPNTERTLVGGLFAEGRVATDSKRALALPAAAVDIHGITPIVRQVKGGRVAETPVTLGARDDAAELVEVAAGLAEGDTVLVGTTQAVIPGARVRVLGEEARR